jgi:uncharacterized protein YdhG (YjbR/CyaY superfamily)
MKYEADSPEEYIQQLPKERQEPIRKLRLVIKQNLPEGFQECINYGMIGYVVPHTIYPNGYHCNPKNPLPFMSIASQKNYIEVYNSGIYAIKELFNWFIQEYPKHTDRALDMGKSCIRFKNINEIPYDLIGDLCTKISVEKWIKTYETIFKKIIKIK